MMRMLAADTSTSITTTALLSSGEIQELNYYGKSAQSSRLFAHFDYLLANAGIDITDIDCLAIGAGPGSFTGLRISFSAFRAFAQSGDIPIVLVNSLDAMAFPYRDLKGTVVVAQYARKGQAYTAFYKDGVLEGGYLFLTTEEIEAQLASLSGPVYLLGGFMSQVKLPDNPAITILQDSVGPTASAIIRIGQEMFENEEVSSLADALPAYLRPSDAEEKFSKAEGSV